MSKATTPETGTALAGRDSIELLSAAKTGAKWMRWWLEQDECECEYGHACGKPDRTRELEQMEAAIAKAEGMSAWCSPPDEQADKAGGGNQGMKAFQVTIDDNRSIIGKAFHGGVTFQFRNGACVTRLSLSYAAIKAMGQIAEAVKAAEEDKKAANAKRRAKKGGEA